MTTQKLLTCAFLNAIHTMRKFYNSSDGCIISRAIVSAAKSEPLSSWKNQSTQVGLRTNRSIPSRIYSHVVDQSDAQSWYLLGRCYMSQQKYPKAYEAYQQAVYRDGRNPTFWCSIGVLYYQINQYRDALDAYSRAIRLNPYISEVWYDLGTLVSLLQVMYYQRANDWHSMSPATTRSMMLWMRTRERPSLIHPTSTSRRAFNFFATADKRTATGGKRALHFPRMFIQTHTKLLAQLDRQDPNGVTRNLLLVLPTLSLAVLLAATGRPIVSPISTLHRSHLILMTREIQLVDRKHPQHHFLNLQGYPVHDRSRCDHIKILCAILVGLLHLVSIILLKVDILAKLFLHHHHNNSQHLLHLNV